MKKFRFRLESVLAWRRQREEAEREQLAALREKLAETEMALTTLHAEWQSALESTVRSASPSSFDLANLDAYAGYVVRATERIQHEIARRRKAVAEQQQAVVEAARQTRLLERLRERQFRLWQIALDRHLESEQADLFLCRWQPE